MGYCPLLLHHVGAVRAWRWHGDNASRKTAAFAVLTTMIMLVIEIFTLNIADTFNYSLALLYIAGAFTTLYSTVVFFDIAPATKQPDLWVVIGRAAKYASTGIFPFSVCTFLNIGL